MAIDDGQERVLCLATEFLWEALARATRQTTSANEVSTSVLRRVATQFQGFRPFSDRLPAATVLDELGDGAPVYLDRTSVLERDAQYKQLIPYGYLTCQDRVWVYQRLGRTGDARLRGRITAGVGGHVNPADQDRSLSTTLLRGLSRELAEEVSYGCGSSIHPVGLINDDSDAVGQVHLGIVYRVELARPEARSIDPNMLGLGWFDGAGLRDLMTSRPCEGWSRMLIEQHLARDYETAGATV